MLTGSTLVVVADGAIARFLTRARAGARLVEIVDSDMHIKPSPPMRDRPMRTQDRTGMRRHAIESRQNPRDAAEEDFLKNVAVRALDLLANDKTARLVLCAPPRALGVLRAALTADARERLTLSWDKDITKETSAEIDTRLQELRVRAHGVVLPAPAARRLPHFAAGRARRRCFTRSVAK
jgi:protein required for attachment to host cells